MADTPTHDSPGRAVRLAVGFGLCYLFAVEVGQFLSFRDYPFATFWPPSGLTLAALLLTRAGNWWLLIVGSLVANFISDRVFHSQPVFVSLLYWSGNTLEALVSAILLPRLGFHIGQLRRMKDVGWLFAVAAFVGAPIGATIGATTLAAYRDVDFGSSWVVWWVGDLLGILVVAPNVLAWSGPSGWKVTRSMFPRVVETGAALVALSMVGNLVFGDVVVGHSPVLQFPYLLFPLLIWVGLRLGPRSAAAAVLLITVGVAYHTTRGQGPFDAVTHAVTERVILLQTFLGVAAFAALALSAEVSERADLAEALRHNENRLRDLFENAHDLIQGVAPDGRLLYANRAWRETLHYDPADVARMSFFHVVHPDFRELCRDRLRRLVSGEVLGRVEIAMMVRDGASVAVEGTSSCRFEGGRPVSIHSIFRDVTARKRAEQELTEQRRLLEMANARLEALATTDPLTGLANRRAFEDALSRELAAAARDGRPLSLAVVDVDHFKEFNDAHGHPAGDLVLRQIAAVLRSTIRGSDLPARIGGEEFAVLLVGADREGARDVAERVRRAVEAGPWDLRPVTISAGVAKLQLEAGEGAAQKLVEDADRAMYRAKRAGRNRVVAGSGSDETDDSTATIRHPESRV